MRNLVMDSQVLNGIQKCAYFYNLSFNEHWTPGYKAEALESGDLLHTIMKVHYLLKIHRPDLNYARNCEISIAFGRQHAISLNQELETSEEVIHHTSEYLKFREGDFWIPKQVERPFAKVLYESEEDDLRIVYEGVVDLVADTQAGETVVDHKSSRRNTDPTSLPLSNQFKGYAWALGINNVVINKIGFQKTLPPKDKFVRHPISYSQEILDEWVANSVFWGKMLAFYLETETFPQNFTSCDKYSGCIFCKACLTEKGDAREWILDQEFHKGEAWNPHTRDKEQDEKIKHLLETA
jgi:hypothetical protein